MHPVDELAQIREQISTLKTREADLRSALAMQRRDLCGARYEAVFTTQRRRVLIKDRLPPDIVSDPTLWDERDTVYLRVRPRPEHSAAVEDDDVVLIESWRDTPARWIA